VGTEKRAIRISGRNLSHLMKTMREVAGIDKPRAGYHANRREGITIAHKEGMSEKEVSEYTGITPEIVKRYIQLDRSDTVRAFEESHPFFKQKTLNELRPEERRRELLNLLRGLSPEAQETIMEMVRN